MVGQTLCSPFIDISCIQPPSERLLWPNMSRANLIQRSSWLFYFTDSTQVLRLSFWAGWQCVSQWSCTSRYRQLITLDRQHRLLFVYNVWKIVEPYRYITTFPIPVQCSCTPTCGNHPGSEHSSWAAGFPCSIQSLPELGHCRNLGLLDLPFPLPFLSFIFFMELWMPTASPSPLAPFRSVSSGGTFHKSTIPKILSTTLKQEFQIGDVDQQ